MVHRPAGTGRVFRKLAHGDHPVKPPLLRAIIIVTIHALAFTSCEFTTISSQNILERMQSNNSADNMSNLLSRETTIMQLQSATAIRYHRH